MKAAFLFRPNWSDPMNKCISNFVPTKRAFFSHYFFFSTFMPYKYRWFVRHIVGICDFMWHSFLDRDRLKRTCSNARGVLNTFSCFLSVFFFFFCVLYFVFCLSNDCATLLDLRGLLFRMQVAHAQGKIRGALTCSMWYHNHIIYDCICSAPGRTDTSPQWQCGNVIAVLWFPLAATWCLCGVECCEVAQCLQFL